MKSITFIILFVLTSFDSFAQNDSLYRNNTTEHLRTADFNIKMNCPNEIKIDSLDYIDQKTYQCKSGNTVLTVIKTTYDNGMYHSDSLERLEFDLMYSQRKFTSSEAVYESEIIPREIDGYPGFEFHYEYIADNKFSVRRVHIVKNTLYELHYEGLKTEKNRIDIEEYFDSFKLKNVEYNPLAPKPITREEALENVVYEANFFDETIVEAQIIKNELGEVYLIVQRNPIMSNSGIVELVILQATIIGHSNDAYKGAMIEGQVNHMKNGIRGSEIILVEDIDIGKRVIATYESFGVEIFDERIMIMSDNHVFTLSAKYKKNQPKDERIDAFFESFEIIK